MLFVPHVFSLRSSPVVSGRARLSELPSTRGDRQSWCSLASPIRLGPSLHRHPGNAPKALILEYEQTIESAPFEFRLPSRAAAGRLAHPWRCHSSQRQRPCGSTLGTPNRLHFSALRRGHSCIPASRIQNHPTPRFVLSTSLLRRFRKAVGPA